MVLKSLGEKLQSSLGKLKDSGRVDEDALEDVVKEIQRALLQGDVEVSVVMDLSDDIKTRALNEEPPSGTTARDHVLRIVYEEMVDLVGESTDIPLESDQTILLAGLQGNGKTTTSAKMAWWLGTKGLKTSLIQTDTDRPGAHAQTEQMAERADVPCYTDADADNPVDIARQGLVETADSDVQVVDTAGRHALEDDLIDEIEDISAEVQPDHTFLVMDAAIGQGAKEQAKRFNDAIGIDGVIITKLDGTAKGGGALSAVQEADASIAFLGTGEEVKDIERFEPSGFISRLLGMGDLKQLSERVERAMQTEDEDDWDPEEMLEGSFTLVDMQHQMRAMGEMGSLDQVLNMIPGMGSKLNGIPDDALGTTEENLVMFETIMDSMTDAELENPSVIKGDRITRIARGSGHSEADVEELLSQYKRMKKMINGMQRGGGGRGGMKQMLRQFEAKTGGQF